MSRVYSLIISVAIFVISVDQWTKHLALQAFSREGESSTVFSWFNFTLVYNFGAAFGMLKNLPDSVRTGFFLLLPIIVLSVLWFSYVRKFHPRELLGPISIGLVIGGALGNLIDRIRQGKVTDFIDWYYRSSGSCLPQFYRLPPDQCHWPVFNIADSAISLAMVLLVIYSFRQPKAAKATA